jgi:nucleoside-diphosphate-sugar epimerase
VTVLNRGRTAADLPPGVGRLTGDATELERSRDDIARLRPEVVLHDVVVTERDARVAVAALAGVAPRLVLLSSMDVYRAYGRLIQSEPGPPDPLPLDEEAPLRERLYPYRDQVKDPAHRLHDYDKIPAERAVLDAKDPAATVLRLPMVYGPNDYQHRLFPYLKPMRDGRPALVLAEEYATWRSTWGYVENVADGIAIACGDGRARGRTYNLADGDFTPLELAHQVAATLGWQGDIVVAKAASLPPALVPPLDTRQGLVASTGRIRRELGFDQRVPFAEAVARTVAWEERHPPEPIPDGTLNYAAEDQILARLRRPGPA